MTSMSGSAEGISSIVVDDTGVPRIQQSRAIEDGASPRQPVQRREGEAVVYGGRCACGVVEDDGFAGCGGVDVVVLAGFDAVRQIEGDDGGEGRAGEDGAALDFVGLRVAVAGVREALAGVGGVRA